MEKNEKGNLTVEASLVLSVFLLFILFLFNFATVYRAENLVSHATLQAADAVALESYLRETSFETDEQKVLFWANKLNGSDSISADSFESLRSADLVSIAKEKFVLAVSDSSGKADSTLKSLGIKDGLAGIDFSESFVELRTNDVIVKTSYTVELKFPVFGATELSLTKAAKAKTAGEILFGINVIPESKIMGVTKGTGKYKLGEEVEISAEENYGYDFVCWDDGNTDNPRKVTVAMARTYVAKFERHSFGVNLFITDPESPDGRTKGSNKYGTVKATLDGVESIGGNEYNYEKTVTIEAVANPGYKFKGWKGVKLTDKGEEKITSKSTTIEAFINGIYDLEATFEPYVYEISVKTECADAKDFIGVRKCGDKDYKKKIEISYGSNFELKTAENDYYSFTGWYSVNAQKTESKLMFKELPVPVGDEIYEAKYTKNPILTVVANEGGTATIVDSNNKDCGAKYPFKENASVKIVAECNHGYNFAGWYEDGKKISDKSLDSVTVTKDRTIEARFTKIQVTVRFYESDNSTLIKNGSITIPYGESFKSSGKSLPSPTVSNGLAFSSWKEFNADTRVYADKNVYGEWVTPKITITASEAGYHSISFTVKTTPENLAVNWSYSVKGEKIKNKDACTLKTNGNKATLTINDSKIIYDNLNCKTSDTKVDTYVTYRTATVWLDVEVLASLKDFDKSASKIVTIEPSVKVGYVNYQDKESPYDRHYYDELQGSGIMDTTKNLTDTNAPYRKTNAWKREWQVTYSAYKDAKTNSVASGSYYYGNPLDTHKQNGRNDSDKTAIPLAYPKSTGSWGAHVLTYLIENKGEKKNDTDYYDYYISNVK